MKTELAPVSIPDVPPGVRVASSPEELSLIQQQHCAAAIWQRHPLPTFQRWIDELDPDLLPCARLITRPDRIPDAVREVCDSTGTPDCAERNRLIDDVGALASIFAGLMRPPWLRLRFDVVDTNACRKFHVDAVTARLICTYRGTGTEYGTGQNQEDPKRIFTVPTGSPILLRGSLWPEQPASGLLHRSPPIEGTGETRLLLVLDPVSDSQDEI